LRLIHQVYLHVLDGQLTSVPLEDPEAILDIGTGTGDWAIAMGELFPDAEVTGIDISAIQDTRVPPNVVFEIDDADDDDWDRPRDYYDLIHFRNMIGAFRDWRFIYEQAFTHLKPGGWIELLDFDDQEGFKRFLSVFPPESDFHTLAKDLAVAAMKSGRPRGMAHLDPRLLMEAGFVDVKTNEHVIPINMFDRHRGSAGKIWLAACLTGLEAVCLRPLTKYMDWDPERLKRVCENVAHEMKCFAFDREKSQGLIIRLRIVVGRKPPLREEDLSAMQSSSMREDGASDETDETNSTPLNGMSISKEHQGLNGNRSRSSFAGSEIS
jgi:SAM-dependent methyltransferase